MDRVATYLRLSSKDNENDESNSISGQRKLIKNFINNDYELKNATKIEFLDDGYSGKNLDRPNFKKLYSYIEQGKITTLIVKDRSRIGRNLIEVGEFTENFLNEHSVRLISILDDVDTKKDNEDDMLKKAMYDLMNELYREDISVKIKKSFESKKKNGTLIEGLPVGYERDGDKVIISKDGDIIKRIFNLYTEHRNAREVCRILNEEKVVTQKKRDKGKKSHIWYSSEIGNILKNTKYYGLCIYNQKDSEDKHIYNHNLYPPIINEELFMEAKKIRLSKKTNKKNLDKWSKLSYSLYCKCGGIIMQKVNSNNVLTCTCQNTLVGVATEDCIKREKVDKLSLDTKVLNTLKKIIEREKVLNDNSKNQVSHIEREIEKVNNKINMTEKEFKELYLNYMNKKISMEAFEVKKSELMTDKSLFEKTLNSLSKKLNYYLSISIDNVDEEIVLKKDLVKKYIKKITILTNGELEFQYN